ncbi:MAG: aminotransferase class I/II-fold pyridoxal phosphate-dependent enzyme [Planctomycetes bacterium]|nr:aminotransferase class I/II-fold pyridoxal phosphate-dependent enzyme [Planctomycetota bacterium]
MSVPMLDLAAENRAIAAEARAAIDAIIDTNQFILGKTVEGFEGRLARYCQSPHAVGVSSGTDALLIALMAAGIGPGDEVIVPTFTFFATGGTVARTGATPVFVDIDPATFNMNVTAAEAALTDKTRAIIPVHLFGQCADMTATLALAKKHELIVIEDAAQAIGARDHDRPAGSMGDYGCLSFYPTKNLGAFGDAGAVLTPRVELLTLLRQIRMHGQTDEYRHQYVGGNFRIDALQAAVLTIKLAHLDAYAEGRRAAAERYEDLLGDLPITLPVTAEGQYHVFNQYTIRSTDRAALCDHLKANGIGHKVYYPLPLHLQPCFESLGYRKGMLPVAEAACDEVVSLPMFPTLSEEQQEEVAAVMRAFYE